MLDFLLKFRKSFLAEDEQLQPNVVAFSAALKAASVSSWKLGMLCDLLHDCDARMLLRKLLLPTFCRHTFCQVLCNELP